MNTETKYTPAPWTLHYEDCTRGGNKGKQILTGICNMPVRQSVLYPNWVQDRDGDVWQAWITCNEANARLIAAAPDLLAACLTARTALQHICQITDETRCGWALKELDTAITKATELKGQQKP